MFVFSNKIFSSFYATLSWTCRLRTKIVNIFVKQNTWRILFDTIKILFNCTLYYCTLFFSIKNEENEKDRNSKTYYQ